ncbi:hypothetical protein DIC66_06325 [Rhodoferax lacus]|uniref:Porin domain-containing protein n=1 Tax=Rhodoferax lacus TaxID=2184758 RepID=A0A3E1RDP8_9BURK|nr:porin [Rhodoferax lacus]RFO97485.1 hypothetical protein DIC66_06325 [Rhodoferax lacus]
MKKTLVALAVLAASGASFAQVTITGELAMGYKSTTTAGAGSDSTSSGLGVNTSGIFFNATEDLGGGMKAVANMGIEGLDRSEEGGALYGTNADLSIITGAGTFKLAAEEQNGSLSGTLAAVAPGWLGQDGKLFAANSDRDSVSWSMPIGPVAVAVKHSESAAGLGEGVGSTGNSGQGNNSISAKYAAGALGAYAAYNLYDNKDGGTFLTLDNKLTLAGSYDLGVAKFGLGFQVAKKVKGSTTDTYLSFAVPFGALTVGGEWGNSKDDLDGTVVAGRADGTRTGMGLGASYALSKRTTVLVGYRSWDNVANSGLGYGKDTQTRVYLDHTF